jgi:hypothetical protein
LGSIEAFFLDAVHPVEIDLVGRRPLGGERQARARGDARGDEDALQVHEGLRVKKAF